jgi:hypothetical protein
MIKNISNLPDNIINIIKEYIPHNKLVFVNKTFYNLYHNTIRKYIPQYQNYIRDIIRRDNDFVFGKIIQENLDIWIKIKQYRYKNMIFNNYIYFVMNFCIENDSERCRQLLLNFLSKRDLCRNLHKKNIIRYIKWKN